MRSQLDAMKLDVNNQMRRLEKLEQKLNHYSHRTYEKKYGLFSCENFYPLRKKENDFPYRLRNIIFNTRCKRCEDHKQQFENSQSVAHRSLIPDP